MRYKQDGIRYKKEGKRGAAFVLFATLPVVSIPIIWTRGSLGLDERIAWTVFGVTVTFHVCVWVSLGFIIRGSRCPPQRLAGDTSLYCPAYFLAFIFTGAVYAW